MPVRGEFFFRACVGAREAFLTAAGDAVDWDAVARNLMGKKAIPLPSLARLRELLKFDLIEFFTWKVSPSNRVKIGDVAGCLNKATGYWYIKIDGKLYSRSRLVWLWFTGEDPGDFEVDHINNIRHDDRFSNLQLLIQGDNRKKNLKHKNNTSGFTGVFWNKSKKKWHARITHNRRNISLGYYNNAEDAARAYDDSARVLRGSLARLNFPKPGEHAAQR